MNDLFFWKSWSPSERRIYTILLTIFLGSLIYYSFSVLRGSNNALDWNITSSAETIEVPVKNIQVGLFEFELVADNYLINQYYQGSAHQITTGTGYVFLTIFCASLIVLLTITTYLKRFWYLVATALSSFIFVNFRLEQLEIFGWIDNTFLIIVLSLILPLSYYIHAFKYELEFTTRLFLFTIVIAIIAILISLFSQNENPFYFLVHYNYTAPVVISILFIFLVSHEIIYLILFLISGSVNQNGKNNLTHFILLSIIYFLNIVLVYLKNSFVIDWDLIYINAFLLLLMSAIIGLWGFKQREIRYENIIPFRPLGSYLFLTLGVICFSTITYHTVTLNDPILETFEDAIVFSHIGFGIMFFFYLMANFINLINKNLSVYKIAYREDNMPYISANLAGLVVIAAFYFLSNQASLQQAIAGYYNGLGSVYYHESDDFLAEEYYKRGAMFGYNNHRSNYSIGELGYHQNDLDKAIQHFKKATQKNPTEFAYINLANAQKAKFLFFDGLFTLKEGVRKFPESSEIKNNLGLLFKGTNLLDSAVYYMEAGANGSWGNKTNTTNIIDLLTRNRVELPVDSLKEIFDASAHLPLKTNLLAYSNNTTKWLDTELSLDQNDSTLDLHQFTYLYNWGFSKLKSPKRSEIAVIMRHATAQKNAHYSRQLTYLSALMQYMSNDLTSFLRSLDHLQNEPVRKGYYNHVMGIVALEQNAPRLAVDFFQKAAEEEYPGAQANLAISLTEAGEKAQALRVWNQLLIEDSTGVANDIMTALTTPINAAINSNSDAMKYQIMKYRSEDLDQDGREQLLSSIDEINFSIGAYASNIRKQVEGGNYREANEHLERIERIDSSSYYSLIAELRSELSMYQIVDGHINIENIGNNEIIGFWSKPNDPVSIKYFRETGLQNPFNEADVIIASRFFSDQVKDMDLAYNILLNAIEINPYAIRLLKEYVLMSVKIGQSNYGQNELQKLKLLLQDKEFEDFQLKVNASIQDFENFTFPSP